MSHEQFDVVVVGAGNAAFSAAHAARERGARVVVLEKAPREWAGGNSYFTVGGFRVVVDSLDSLRPILDPDAVDEDKLARTDLPPYPAEEYLADMRSQTKGRCDPALTQALVGDSADVVRWLHGKGIRWTLMYPGQAFEIDGRFKFWGGFYLGTVNGGKGLIAQHIAAAEASGIEIRYSTRATRLLRSPDGRVTGVAVNGPDGEAEIHAGAVVLAAGGFEADRRKRAAYLGPGWDLAHLRGTPHNTGDGLDIAMEAGAVPAGHWSGCHAVSWDAGSVPDTGDREIAYAYTKHMYPLGIMVNTRGERFLDEGADFRGLTYAEYGGRILTQPGALAYQVFDGRTIDLLRKDQYVGAGATMVEADTIEELAELMEVDPARLRSTVDTFNAATHEGHFDPAEKDGLGTSGIEPPKSNWALPLDTAPYRAYKVTCGITFTYGGIKVDADSRVLDATGAHIAGLFSAGEMVGGLFYHNYPGGAGLTSGAVFGRRAGWGAADAALAAAR
jgi:tricarballylate dehydrogenase